MVRARGLDFGGTGSKVLLAEAEIRADAMNCCIDRISCHVMNVPENATILLSSQLCAFLTAVWSVPSRNFFKHKSDGN